MSVTSVTEASAAPNRATVAAARPVPWTVTDAPGGADAGSTDVIAGARAWSRPAGAGVSRAAKTPRSFSAVSWENSPTSAAIAVTP